MRSEPSYKECGTDPCCMQNRSVHKLDLGKAHGRHVSRGLASNDRLGGSDGKKVRDGCEFFFR